MNCQQAQKLIHDRAFRKSEAVTGHFFFADPEVPHGRENYITAKLYSLVASSGIEPELSALRGRRVNQLHHDATVE